MCSCICSRTKYVLIFQMLSAQFYLFSMRANYMTIRANVSAHGAFSLQNQSIRLIIYAFHKWPELHTSCVAFGNVRFRRTHAHTQFGGKKAFFFVLALWWSFPLAFLVSASCFVKLWLWLGEHNFRIFFLLDSTHRRRYCD